jgi:hypothetical protein
MQFLSARSDPRDGYGRQTLAEQRGVGPPDKQPGAMRRPRLSRLQAVNEKSPSRWRSRGVRHGQTHIPPGAFLDGAGRDLARLTETSGLSAVRLCPGTCTTPAARSCRRWPPRSGATSASRRVAAAGRSARSRHAPRQPAHALATCFFAGVAVAEWQAFRLDPAPPPRSQGVHVCATQSRSLLTRHPLGARDQPRGPTRLIVRSCISYRERAVQLLLRCCSGYRRAVYGRRRLWCEHEPGFESADQRRGQMQDLGVARPTAGGEPSVS